jgi:hypothetical protein
MRLQKVTTVKLWNAEACKWCSHGQGMHTRNSFWPARRGHSVPKFLRLGRRTGWEKLPGRASFPLPTNGTIGSQYQTPRKRNSHEHM